MCVLTEFRRKADRAGLRTDQAGQSSRLQIVTLADVVGHNRGRYDRAGRHQRVARSRTTDQEQLPAVLVAALVLLVQIHVA